MQPFQPLTGTLTIAADSTTGAAQALAAPCDMVRVHNKGPNEAWYAVGPDSTTGAAASSGASQSPRISSGQTIYVPGIGPSAAFAGAKTTGAETASVDFTPGRGGL